MESQILARVRLYDVIHTEKKLEIVNGKYDKRDVPSSVFSRGIILGDRVPQIDPLKILGDPSISGIIEV